MTTGPTPHGPIQPVLVTVHFPNRPFCSTPIASFSKTVLEPFSPQEPRGCPGGRLLVQTKI